MVKIFIWINEFRCAFDKLVRTCLPYCSRMDIFKGNQRKLLLDKSWIYVQKPLPHNPTFRKIGFLRAYDFRSLVFLLPANQYILLGQTSFLPFASRNPLRPKLQVAAVRQFDMDSWPSLITPLWCCCSSSGLHLRKTFLHVHPISWPGLSVFFFQAAFKSWVSYVPCP